MESLEVDSFQLILHSGNARSFAYEALSYMKRKDIQKSFVVMKQAHAEMLLAQKKHAQLLRRMANNERIEVDLLLIHAENHVASSQVAVELIDEMIQIYERIGEKNEE